MDKRSLAIGIAGGFVSGGCLLSYQLALGFGWGTIISGIVAIFVGVLIYKIALKKVRKN